MNACLAFPSSLSTPNFADALRSIAGQFAFLRPVSSRSAQRITPSMDVTSKGLVSILDDIIEGAIRLQSDKEFEQYRSAKIIDYLQVSRALSDITRISVPEEVREQLKADSFEFLERDLSLHGDAFGEVVRDQALFTVWTLKKINSVILEIAKRHDGLLPEHAAQDDDFAANFGGCVVWTRFHLDCLTTSIRLKSPIYPGVRDSIADGLRAAVNAYAFAKQGMNLRSGEGMLALDSAVGWDDEDQELLDASMDDLASEVDY